MVWSNSLAFGAFRNSTPFFTCIAPPTDEPAFTFADADADGAREAVFVNNEEVGLIDPRDPGAVNWRSSFNIGFPPAFRLLGISDMTNDGFEEFIAALPETRQVIVFSDNPATSIRR